MTSAVISGRVGPRDRRALVIGAVLIGVALFVRAGVLPFTHALADSRQAVERERDLLGRERAVLAEVKRYPDRVAPAERALLDEAPRLFGGTDLATASAALMNYVSSRAVRHRVFVQQSAGGTPVAVAAGVARLQVDLRTVGDLAGILTLLQDLEGGPKLLTIDDLVITQAERLRVSAVTQDEEVLAMSASVSGYALGDVEADSNIPAGTSQAAR